VERLYDRLQLHPVAASHLSAALEAEVVEHRARQHAEAQLSRDRLATLDEQRRKVLEAYYGGAINLELLRSEQSRISTQHHETAQHLRGVEAGVTQWRAAIDRALRFATETAPTYRGADC
jgi:FixJ family two-component response regulator